MTRKPARHEVWLPWVDPRSVRWPPTPRRLNLCGKLWARLRAPDYLGRVEARLRDQFASLDARPELEPAELRRLNNAARGIALLSHLRAARGLRDADWDEYLCRLSVEIEPWLLRLTGALPFPGFDRDAPAAVTPVVSSPTSGSCWPRGTRFAI